MVDGARPVSRQSGLAREPRLTPFITPGFEPDAGSEERPLTQLSFQMQHSPEYYTTESVRVRSRVCSHTITLFNKDIDIFRPRCDSLPMAGYFLSIRPSISPCPGHRPPQRVCLGVEHIIIQTDQFRPREDEIKVLERLGNPEALSTNC